MLYKVIHKGVKYYFDSARAIDRILLLKYDYPEMISHRLLQQYASYVIDKDGTVLKARWNLENLLDYVSY